MVRDTRLILVEGMPGTGKSTVSQCIDRQLRANGQRSYWCQEESAVHPVRLFYDSQRHLSWSDYSAEAAARWQNYARQVQTRGEIAVLDASILQNHVRSMLLFDCPWNAILGLVRRIEHLLVSLRPVWIYLKPNDVERNFRDVVAVRGEHLLDLWVDAQQRFPYSRRSGAAGYVGFIAFWEEFGAIADRIFSDLAISKLLLNVARDDWHASIGGIHDFLDLPLSSAYAPPLGRFVGQYVPIDDPTASGISLRASGGCLIAVCDRPTMDTGRGPIGCYRELRLVPKEKNRFYVAAWPHEVEFAEDASGTVVGLRLSVAADGWSQGSEMFVKR
jgi:hypothetical protein